MAVTVALLSRLAPASLPAMGHELADALTRQLGTEVRVVPRGLAGSLPGPGADGVDPDDQSDLHHGKDLDERVDLAWLYSATPDDIVAARAAYPRAGLLVTLSRGSRPDDVVRAFALGADLVQDDEGLSLACAALVALARRGRRARPPQPQAC